MSTFEERLLDELRKVAAADDTMPPPVEPGRRFGRNRRTVFGLAASMLLATGIAVGAPLLGEGSSAGARPFEVIRKDDGRILFRVVEFRNPEALEQRLRELGVAVVVDYVPASKRCREPRFAEHPMSGDDLTAIYHRKEIPAANGDGPGAAAFEEASQGWHELVPGLIPPGTTLVLTEGYYDGTDHSGSLGSYALAAGPVAPCELEPKPGYVPPPRHEDERPHSPGAHHPTPAATSKP
ncbi:hypothetical protein [Embleya hyalina]|uniref:Uncharacterized protein n=1 Tax=Embleya hyalina TaxID=516124 RepID=A0A401YWM9_9ACTN|nr:hypothetical protein [Embleya hyalina]GCD99032.1 hypothetical protein EHYA_06744 [Embleya hyalina]